jgi:hypothetical protein
MDVVIASRSLNHRHKAETGSREVQTMTGADATASSLRNRFVFMSNSFGCPYYCISKLPKPEKTLPLTAKFTAKNCHRFEENDERHYELPKLRV